MIQSARTARLRNAAIKYKKLGLKFAPIKQLQSTHRVQTFANAVRYPKAYPPKSVINIHPQLFQFVFNR